MLFRPHPEGLLSTRHHHHGDMQEYSTQPAPYSAIVAAALRRGRSNHGPDDEGASNDERRGHEAGRHCAEAVWSASHAKQVPILSRHTARSEPNCSARGGGGGGTSLMYFLSCSRCGCHHKRHRLALSAVLRSPAPSSACTARAHAGHGRVSTQTHARNSQAVTSPHLDDA